MLRIAPQDEDIFVVPSIIYLILAKPADRFAVGPQGSIAERSNGLAARRARLEGRTADLQRGVSIAHGINFHTRATAQRR
jgi:hypothetical protein